jgi:hypothetical protein
VLEGTGTGLGIARPSNRHYEGETSHSGPRRCAAMGERRRRSIPALPRSDPGAEALPGHRAGHAKGVDLRRLRAGDRGLILRPLDAAGPQDHGRAALVGPNPVLGSGRARHPGLLTGLSITLGTLNLPTKKIKLCDTRSPLERGEDERDPRDRDGTQRYEHSCEFHAFPPRRLGPYWAQGST